MADVDLMFLPWVRRGGTTALAAPDSLTEGQAGVASASAALVVNDTPPVRMDVRLMGPGHVIGLQPGQVIRMDPTPGSRAFEPNYAPLVEFDEPSLPWLFTPAAADAQNRLRPWLCLVVVRKQPGVRIGPPRRGALPVLTIAAPADPNVELPDLASAWAWAHAQLTGELPPRGAGGESDAAVAEITRLLDDRPDRNLSRLVSGRVLAPDTEYIACVVPTFELGRLAGLGLEVTAAEETRLRPAWTLGDEPTAVELPVYHWWEFATGPNGDFQSLAMLLRARSLPRGVGERLIDVSASGLDVAVPEGTALQLGGALRPVELPDPREGTNPDVAIPATWPSEALREAVRTRLAALLDAADALPSDDPLLAPPRYGSTQSGQRSLDPSRHDRWYEQLNLEPPARATAQFGAQLAREQQEALVASAWEQAAELPGVNSLLRTAELGMVLGTSTLRRHVATMEPGAGLQLLSPARAQLSRTAAANRPGVGLVALWTAAQVPVAAFGTTMRQLARPQGSITRRVVRRSTGTSSPVRAGSVVAKLQPSAILARRFLVPVTDGLATIEQVAFGLRPPRFDISWAEASASAVTGAPPRPTFVLQPFTPPRTDPRPPVFEPQPPVIVVDPRPPVVVDPRPPVVVDPRPGSTVPRPRPNGPRPVEPLARLRPNDPDIPFPDPLPLPDPPDDPPRPPRPPRPPLPPKRDSTAAAAFRAAAAAHLQRFDPRRPVPPRPTFEVADLSIVFGEALLRAAPIETYATWVGQLVDRGAGATPPPTGTSGALDTVDFVPRFQQPLAPMLAAMDQDLMLPGLDLVPPNTVVPLRTNSPFVDAVMVGFNDELGHELVWREFPTPLQATYADRFWDAGAVAAPPDIPPLPDWGDRQLGGGGAGDERFVVMLRSELLRRYPDAVVYATKPGLEPAMPILTGGLEPDVRFFGFDIPAAEIAEWSIVIAEQPTAPRFGVEVDEVPAGAGHLALTATDGDAARLAVRLRQQPVRVTIPATVLLGQESP